MGNLKAAGINLNLKMGLDFLKYKLSSKLVPVYKTDNTRSNFRPAGLIVFCLFFLAATAACSAPARITDLVLRNSQSEIMVDFRIEDYFTQEMQATIRKGVPITILFSVALYEIRNYWFDNKLIDKTVFYRMHYDVLRKEYRIQPSWEKSDPVIEKDFLQARKFLSEIKGLDIVSLSKLKKGIHYQLRIKSELNEYKIRFTGFPWAFETEGYTTNFVY